MKTHNIIIYFIFVLPVFKRVVFKEQVKIVLSDEDISMKFKIYEDYNNNKINNNVYFKDIFSMIRYL